MMLEGHETNRAFNEGSDARLKGWPFTANPYLAMDRVHGYWRAGWLHVDGHWGIGARWPVKVLPEVR